MSLISRLIDGLAWPRPTMSKDCINGTPARSIVESCRVNRARSFSVMRLPREKLCLRILEAIIPRRRSEAATTDSPPARISPLTTRPCLSRPSQRNITSRTCSRGRAIAPVAMDALRYCFYSLVQPSTSSIEVMPCFTFMSPERRKSLTPSRVACSAISIALPPRRMICWIASLIGIT